MGLDLNYKNFTRYDGSNVQVADYLNSDKWVHALSKFGVDKNSANNLFSYWQTHPYLDIQRNFNTNTQYRGSPWDQITGKKDNYRLIGLYDQKRQSQDPFKGMRLGDKGISGDNDNAFYSTTKKVRQTKDNFNPFAGEGNYEWVDKTTKKQGRLLNNTFIENDAYDKLNDQQRQYYGLTFDQAFQKDPRLAQAGQGVNAALEYRRQRNAKGASTGFGAFAPKALSLAGALTGNPYIAAISGGLEGGISGGSFTDALTGGLKSFAGQNGFGSFGGLQNTPGFNPNALQGSSNVSIFDSIGNLFKGNDFLGDLGGIFNTPGFFPNSNGSNNPLDIFSSGSSGGIFDTINNVLDSPLGQLGSSLLGGYLNDREASQYSDRLRSAAEGAEFNPYNAQGPGGGVTYNNGQVSTYLSPAMQALANQLYGSASGNVNAFNSYDPAQQAGEQFNILENIAQPYRDKERDSLMSTLINQGVYNPGANESSPGYWQPRYLEDSINASRDQNLFNSYDLAQQTATNTLNRGIGSLNSLNALNYGPLQYAGLGGDLGRAQSSAYSKGIPLIKDAAQFDYANDSNIFNSLLNSLGRRV